MYQSSYSTPQCLNTQWTSSFTRGMSTIFATQKKCVSPSKQRAHDWMSRSSKTIAREHTGELPKQSLPQHNPTCDPYSSLEAWYIVPPLFQATVFLLRQRLSNKLNTCSSIHDQRMWDVCSNDDVMVGQIGCGVADRYPSCLVDVWHHSLSRTQVSTSALTTFLLPCPPRDSLIGAISFPNPCLQCPFRSRENQHIN